jgi:hypothetical protein
MPDSTVALDGLSRAERREVRRILHERPGARFLRTRSAAGWEAIRRKYGLTPRMVARLFEAQGGCCALCRQSKELVFDHDHATGAYRGLLCTACNVGIAAVERLGIEAVRAYIHPAREEHHDHLT